MNDKAIAAAATIDREQLAVLEKVIAAGDLKGLTTAQRLDYYNRVCASVGLNPLTRPFEYLELNGKLTLYARKDCTDQLRAQHNVSVHITGRQVLEGCFIVTASAALPNGRTDESIGAVPVPTQQGEARANAMMKAETKSKRRVTLSICGLGFLDESETESIPGAVRVAIDPSPGAAQAAATPVDDRAEQHRFWGVAKQLGYLDAAGKIDKARVHTALGLGTADGQLRAWINAGHSWTEAVDILESLPPPGGEPPEASAGDKQDASQGGGPEPACADCGYALSECSCADWVGSAGPKEPAQQGEMIAAGRPYHP